MVRKNLETEHIEDGNYMKFLMNVSALRQLSRKELEVLNAACVKEYFEAGKQIIYEGDVKCEKFYIIIKGSVKITKIKKESPEMEEEEVGRLGSSQCFGERALQALKNGLHRCMQMKMSPYCLCLEKFSKRLYLVTRT